MTIELRKTESSISVTRVALTYQSFPIIRPNRRFEQNIEDKHHIIQL